MMHIKATFLFCSAFILLSGCDALKTDDAVTYNDAIVNEINGAVDDVVAGSNIFYEGTYEEVSGANTNMKKKLDLRLNTIRNVPEFNSDTALRNRALAWVGFYRRLCDNELSKVVDYLRDTPREELDEDWIDEQIQSAIAGEDAFIDAFNEVQSRFASRYNFVIEVKDTTATE